MQEVSDIWFRTELDLETLGSKLGLREISHDYENYWEWITGYIDNHHLDITRTHRIESDKTDTRIFLVNEDTFNEGLINRIVDQLKDVGIKSIHLGMWVHKTDEEFDKKVMRIIS